MVFLTSLQILDTGFLTVTSRGTQDTTTDARVNDGDALELKGVNFDITATSTIDENPSPGYRPSDIKDHEKRALITINPIQITLKLMFNAANTDGTNVYGINDMSLLKEVLRLPYTPYFKALYYPVDNTATDTGANSTRRRNSQIVYQLGETDTTESQGDIDLTLWTGTTSASSKDLTDVNYIPVKFKSVKIQQVPNNKIEVTLQGVVTG